MPGLKESKSKLLKQIILPHFPCADSVCLSIEVSISEIMNVLCDNRTIFFSCLMFLFKA
jgi:hypothetical protein